MPSFSDRLKHAWNAFNSRDPTPTAVYYGSGNSYNPYRYRMSRDSERSITTAIYNRIAIDVASIDFRHVRLDSNGRFSEEIDSGLNYCLKTEANIDQTGRAFIQDAAFSMLDDGCIAIVPVDTAVNPDNGASIDIRTMRVGKVVEWYPQHVRLNVYNDATGRKEYIVLPKKTVAIVENPLYAIMNEPNSTLQRLKRKLNILDAIDEQSGSGKLDLIIQLPYVIKTDARRKQADERRKQIEMQLAGSKYGIAYTDGTERITQLNRSVDNNLMKQIEYLTSMLYGQLGITEEVINGTADEQTMLNYNNRTVQPIATAIAEAMVRSFLSKTARSQHQSIIPFKDPFKLVPVNNIAEIADKFTRNEIMSPNEVRTIIGMKPVPDERADELRNRNLSEAKGAQRGPVSEIDQNGNKAVTTVKEATNA